MLPNAYDVSNVGLSVYLNVDKQTQPLIKDLERLCSLQAEYFQSSWTWMDGAPPYAVEYSSPHGEIILKKIQRLKSWERAFPNN